jgi:hypothetical protein
MDRRSIRRGAVVVTLAAAAVSLLPGAALAATVTATPSTVAPGGTFTVTANCSTQATSATLSGTSFGGPEQIPLDVANAAGSSSFASTVTMPTTTLAGEYQLSVTCSDGDSGTGTIVVSPTGTNAGLGGTSGAADVGALAVGGALLALGAAGLVVLTRRRADADA